MVRVSDDRQSRLAPQRIPAEVNKFTGGLNTDASPLNYPENTVKEIKNVILNRVGTNYRRLGMDYEASYVETTTAQNSTDSLRFNTYKWENAGGNPDKSLMVVQTGTEFTIYDLDTVPVSNGAIYTKTYTSITSSDRISFSQADGYLVAVQGDGLIYTYEYNAGTVTETTARILVRDLWGVDAIIDGDNLREGNNVTIRPASINSEHHYNLRNQSWGIQRIEQLRAGDGNKDDNESLDDPIEAFNDVTGSPSLYPSNSDSVNYALYPNAGDLSHPNTDRFWPDDLYRNKIGSFEAPRGYFIIDALQRGTSRVTVLTENRTKENLNNYGAILPDDTTPGGATTTEQFAGRIWYGGFSGAVTDGDAKSPNLSSYLMFSRLVKDRSDINQCYQVADPTSNDDPNIVATDGGYVRVDGAFNIQAIVAVGSSLVILAQNGVWRLLGGSDYGFSADNYVIDKLSDESCNSPDSVVYVDGSVFFWGDNGIYKVGTDQFGDWKVMNVIKDRIQTLYDTIDFADKNAAQGLYDKFDRKVRWVYNNRIGSSGETTELIWDVDLDAFYENDLSSASASLPKVVAIAETNPFVSGSSTENVTVNGVQVTVNAVDVTVTEDTQSGLQRELVYITVTQYSPVIKYTLSNFTDADFIDWLTYDSTGVDAHAYFITGEFPTQDYQRRKQVGTLIVNMERTEDGVVDDGTGRYVLVDQSSCMVQARWDWSNSENSSRWSVPRQYYRYKRHYTPADLNDTVDTGFAHIVAKDKIRGHGKALSLKFYSEPLKNFKVNGWSMIWEVGQGEGD